MCFTPPPQFVFEILQSILPWFLCCSWPGDLPATPQWLYITPTLSFLHACFLATDNSHDGSWGPGASHTLWIKAAAEHSFGAKSHSVNTCRQERLGQIWPAKCTLVYCIRDCFASAQMKIPVLLKSIVIPLKYIFIYFKSTLSVTKGVKMTPYAIYSKIYFTTLHRFRFKTKKNTLNLTL